MVIVHVYQPVCLLVKIICRIYTVLYDRVDDGICCDLNIKEADGDGRVLKLHVKERTGFFWSCL
jgi:hypothetical protein